jgi:predicted HAD superfamily phosphohydrolase YqeG
MMRETVIVPNTTTADLDDVALDQLENAQTGCVIADIDAHILDARRQVYLAAKRECEAQRQAAPATRTATA